MNIVKCIDLVMLYFVTLFRVFLLLWTLLVVPTSSDKNEGSDAGMVINFIEKIIKPYIDNHNSVNDKPRQRTSDNDKIRTEIIQVIRLKVVQLRPMLQDKENHKNTKIEKDRRLNFEGNDETVILEMPEKIRRTKVKLAVKENKNSSDTFKKKIENYKQIRKHITLLLDKENTSNFTNKLITTTLDEMLDLLIKKQCKWKSVYTGDLTKHLDKNSRRSMVKLRNKGKTLDQYRLACYLQPKNKDAAQNYYFRHDDPKIKPSDTDLHQKNIEMDQNQCGTFIICSDELRNFLKITYNYLNDTAVATFRNYAAMYTRDVLKKTVPFHDIVRCFSTNEDNAQAHLVTD
ncbi:hypothetical protein PYW08_004857 [Mythimna loreyi]|uniref:Uncharacterized protein n=1 Tax=Mythimna loreyi TaxID=667449 RepID=A0ACC2QFC9_9NEOP|nr:hypothetical protein PYW08_004857 [Mythimna loreyi]